MSLNEQHKIKRNLRNTKAWKQLRHDKNVEQGGIDPITGGKLTKTANLHRMDLYFENYTKIEDHDKFVLLNKLTHDFVHWIYKYYVKDKDVIERIVKILDKMVEINS